MKFMVWKTNKKSEENYPGYVFVHTNFISTRAEPFSLEVRVLDSEAQIMRLYRDSVARNVKTGRARIDRGSRQASTGMKGDIQRF